jgi:hypothetical protein
VTVTASRPRTVPLRPLAATELLDGAVRLVRANARAAFAIALPFAIVRTVLTALVALATYRATDAVQLQTLMLLGVTGFFGTARTGALAPLLSGDVVGQRLGLRRALAPVLPALLGLFVLAGIVTVGEGAGALALGVGGVWLWGVWAVAAPALVLERLSPLRALGRSFALVRGAFWRTWGVRALGWLLTYVLAEIATIPFLALAAATTGTDPLRQATEGVAQPSLYVAITAIGTLVAATIAGPVSSAIDVLLYTDLRMRREGMDIAIALPPTAPTDVAPTQPVTAW